jgi:hypothetical protein
MARVFFLYFTTKKTHVTILKMPHLFSSKRSCSTITTRRHIALVILLLHSMCILSTSLPQSTDVIITKNEAPFKTLEDTSSSNAQNVTSSSSSTGINVTPANVWINTPIGSTNITPYQISTAVLSAVVFLMGSGCFIKWVTKCKQRASSSPPSADDKEKIETEAAVATMLEKTTQPIHPPLSSTTTTTITDTDTKKDDGSKKVTASSSSSSTITITEEIPESRQDHHPSHDHPVAENEMVSITLE